MYSLQVTSAVVMLFVTACVLVATSSAQPGEGSYVSMVIPSVVTIVIH